MIIILPLWIATCNTAAEHYPSLRASHPEHAQRKMAAMWMVWLILTVSMKGVRLCYRLAKHMEVLAYFYRWQTISASNFVLKRFLKTPSLMNTNKMTQALNSRFAFVWQTAPPLHSYFPLHQTSMKLETSSFFFFFFTSTTQKAVRRLKKKNCTINPNKNS